jgi:hypothetical protein
MINLLNYINLVRNVKFPVEYFRMIGSVQNKFLRRIVMYTKYHPIRIVTLLIAVIALSACAPQAASVSPAASQPMATPTSLPAATQTFQPASTATSAPALVTQTSAQSFEAISSGLDNATQARIRTVSEVMGAPNTTVYVNGVPAFNGDREQKNIAAGLFSGFLYVKPGTYSIALVPDGETLDQALFKPVDVKAEAGHRYTVAAMGQLADKDIHPLVVDETGLEAGLSVGTSDFLTIDINNMKGADSITEMADGKIIAENIRYGEARPYVNASGTPQFKTIANGKTQGILGDAPDRSEAGGTSVIPWFGPFPADNYDSVGTIAQVTSERNLIDFLAGFDQGRPVIMDGHTATFNTLLKIIDKAGLRDQLVNSGPYFLLAPTDEAFAAMSQADLDALLNDPQALKNFLNAYIIDGYYPFGNLSGAVYGHSDRILMNRLGQKLAFSEDNLNDQPIGPNYTVGNGIRLNIIFNLLPSK